MKRYELKYSQLPCAILSADNSFERPMRNLNYLSSPTMQLKICMPKYSAVGKIEFLFP